MKVSGEHKRTEDITEKNWGAHAEPRNLKASSRHSSREIHLEYFPYALFGSLQLKYILPKLGETLGTQ